MLKMVNLQEGHVIAFYLVCLYIWMYSSVCSSVHLVVRFGQLLCCADTRIVNIMKVYIERNYRIHHVTASMTTIHLIINLGQDVLESVTTLFKLVFKQFYLCYCLVRSCC